jgi:hypothetical protein
MILGKKDDLTVDEFELGIMVSIFPTYVSHSTKCCMHLIKCCMHLTKCRMHFIKCRMHLTKCHMHFIKCHKFMTMWEYLSCSLDKLEEKYII